MQLFQHLVHVDGIRLLPLALPLLHDGHSLGRHSSIRMHLFQHLVHVDGIRLLPLALLLLVTLGDNLSSFAKLSSSLSRSLGLFFEVR